MALQSLPYDGNGLSGDSGPYNSAEWRKTWFSLFGNLAGATNPDANAGVLQGVADELEVLVDSPASTDVIVSTGAAFIQGMWVNNDADVNVTVSANATGSTRYDIVYIEYDLTTRLPSIGIAVGTVNLPTLTQNLAGVYQIPLAYIAAPNGFVTIAATDIFDMRIFANVPRRTKVLVQNVSGAAVNYGDLAVWSSTTSGAITTNNSALDPVAGVVEGYIANNGYGYIVTNGVAPVKITGTVNRGEQLSHSATLATAAALDSLTPLGIALQPSTAAVNSRILVNVSITPHVEIQTTKGDLLVRNNANEIVRLAVPTTDGYPLTALAANATGWQSGGMSPLGASRKGVALTKTANQTVSDGVATDITWNTETWDTDGYHSGSNADITIPAGLGGTYQLSGIINVIQGGGASRVDASIAVRVNGATVRAINHENIGSATGMSIEFSFPIALAATDSVTIRITMTSSGGTAASRTVIGGATQSLWSLMYIGQSV